MRTPRMHPRSSIGAADAFVLLYMQHIEIENVATYPMVEEGKMDCQICVCVAVDTENEKWLQKSEDLWGISNGGWVAEYSKKEKQDS